MSFSYSKLVKRKPTLISDEQWALADEVARDVRIYVDMILGLERAGAFRDDFTNYLALWAGLLGALAWEHYTGVVSLLRVRNVRSAFTLSRPLFEYFVRLCYYRKQAEPSIATWRADPRKMKSIKNGLMKTHAYADWFSIVKKMVDWLKLADPDMSDVTPEELHNLIKMFDFTNTQVATNRSYRHMLTTVWPENQLAQDRTYALWLRRSAYLHGDPLVRNEVLIETLEDKQLRYASSFEESEMNAVEILKLATGHMLEWMYQTYLATDRIYALQVLGRKVLIAFPTLESENPLPFSVAYERNRADS
ncbi:MAG: hypothetical protein NVSMB64_22940 [Candidatus Velthaea sp.]